MTQIHYRYEVPNTVPIRWVLGTFTIICEYLDYRSKLLGGGLGFSARRVDGVEALGRQGLRGLGCKL